MVTRIVEARSRRAAAIFLVAASVFLLVPFAPVTAPAGELTPLQALGERLFFDPNLSNPPGQACAECHDPEAGWGGPDSAVNAAESVYEGAVHVRSGNRKPPTSAYAGFGPLLHACGDPAGMSAFGCGCLDGGMGCACGPGMAAGGGMGGGEMGGGMAGCACGSGCACAGTTCSCGPGCSCAACTLSPFAGGLFYDGRASGWTLGDPLAEQAMGPFLNPLEQASPNAKLVCLRVRASSYASLFEEAWGPGSIDCVKDPGGTYERIARAIAAFERSSAVNPFDSKFDAFWRAVEARRSLPRPMVPPVQNINGMNWTRFAGFGLDNAELKGLAVFNTKGHCSTCHPLRPGPGGTPPLFTDFRYHNLGMPANPLNPFYGAPTATNPDREGWVDGGLGSFLSRTAGAVDLDGNPRDYASLAPAAMGRHRTPTLRNVDLRPYPEFVKAYGHNGYFKSLPEIVHFYNFRDVLPLCDAGGSPGIDCWPAPEVAENVDPESLGNLGLEPQEGMALIAFLKTLSDGYVAAGP
jgi:cytochrome c peroxidase